MQVPAAYREHVTVMARLASAIAIIAAAHGWLGIDARGLQAATVSVFRRVALLHYKNISRPVSQLALCLSARMRQAIYHTATRHMVPRVLQNLGLSVPYVIRYVVISLSSRPMHCHLNVLKLLNSASLACHMVPQVLH